MGLDWLLALVFFEFASGFTPGPNNVLALAIGFSHGYRKTLPHILGVAIGFPLMLLAIGFFLKPVMDRVPMLFDLLRFLSVAVVIWIAWKIATAPVEEELEEGKEIARHPITFAQSLMLQWINPKAWAGALTIVTIYTVPGAYATSLFAAAFVTIFMTFSAVSLWSLSGRYIKKLMSDPKKIRFFNILMAILLLISVAMMLF
jgi:threonine/homoserine/homoserine lactone efflux protein